MALRLYLLSGEGYYVVLEEINYTRPPENTGPTVNNRSMFPFSFNSASARGGLALHGMGLKLEWANEDVHVNNGETAADEQGSTWGSAGKLNDGRQLPPPTEGAVDNPHPTGGWPPRLG